MIYACYCYHKIILRCTIFTSQFSIVNFICPICELGKVFNNNFYKNIFRKLRKLVPSISTLTIPCILIQFHSYAEYNMIVCADIDCCIALFFADDTGVNRGQTLIPTCILPCLLQLCIKPMRYIYHPQSNCYFAITLPLCCRPCELTLNSLIPSCAKF